MKNVAYIQDIGLLTKEQIKKYMGNIKNLTSEDPVKIYKFIVCCNKCYKITNFCLNINGQSLKDVSDLIKINHKLDKCIFISTRSNVDKIQAEVAKNIFFSLSPLSVIMSDYSGIKPNNVMTIVSNRNDVYYNQIYNTGPEPKYRISELTVEKVNDFVDNGNSLELLIALRIVQIYNISSNVCILGLTQAYEGINTYTLYDNCAIQLTNLYKQWKYFIRKKIVFNFFSNNSNSSIKTQKSKNNNGNYFGTLRTAIQT